MKIEGYEVEEVAPGVKTYTRKNERHTTFDTRCPWIHFHYQTDDEESDRLGYTEAELCCHACETALWLTADWPLEPGAARPVRERFVEDHADCWRKYKPKSEVEAALMKALESQGNHPMESICPQRRKLMFSLDLRGK